LVRCSFQDLRLKALEIGSLELVAIE